MSSSVFSCTEFRAHHLRPDKCRNCFGDKSRHPNEQQQEQSAGEQTSSQSPLKNSTATPTSTGRQQESIHERLMSTPEPISTNNLTRDELVEELLKCRQDRASLRERERKYQSEIERLKAEIDQDGTKNNDDSKAELEALRDELRCVKLERDQAREEQRTLEREMDELHDNFKEEESEQFEQLKQELDAAVKNCKIMQIKLNKCERQYGQLEQVKQMLERQVSELQAASIRSSREGPSSNSNQQNATSNAANFVQLGADFVKLSAREYDQLLRDLNDTTERERDLQEQIKYSQEEAQLKSDKLQALEAENELLLGKVNKLTLANSRLRSSPLRSSMEQASGENNSGVAKTDDRMETSELIQQNEQLKLALDVAQGECQRVRERLAETKSTLDARDSRLRELESRCSQMELELAHTRQSGNQAERSQWESRLELECRQLRSRLVQSERDCKQLRAQLDMLTSNKSASVVSSVAGRQVRGLRDMRSSLSMESASDQTKYKEINRQLEEQCRQLQARNADLEQKLNLIGQEKNVGNTSMESDLLEKLRRQLDISENELAKAKSRLVEMDLECGRAQRQYKRLANSLESNEFAYNRRVKLPAENMRDAMSRQELRDYLHALELELEECIGAMRAKDCLLKEMQMSQAQNSGAGSPTLTSSSSTSEEQLKSLRRIVDQERLLSDNLKVDLAALEQTKSELEVRNSMLERERVSMEEELEKLHQVNAELHKELCEARKSFDGVTLRLKEIQMSYDKMRTELNQIEVARASEDSDLRNVKLRASQRASGASSEANHITDSDILLMSRDLSELKVKNGFLMRQLEIAREDAGRQMDELRASYEAQQRRAVELVQIEMKERQLSEQQQLKEELAELKQKLATCQRQVSKADDEVAQERDRLRAADRDWRREKSQWQQKLEQLEAQHSIERRSVEFRVKEVESQVREKERELLAMQDRYVQLERDQKRLQNKYKLLEEDSQTKIRDLSRELDQKKRCLAEMAATIQKREDEFYSNCARFNTERATLLEALESIKQSYDEKINELNGARELLQLRQENAYKERQNLQDRIDNLTDQLIAAGEHESQVKLLRHHNSTLEKQLEATKRDYMNVKEERVRLRTRCDELERRCHEYEKQELINKTSSISSATGNFLRARSPFRAISAKSSKNGSAPKLDPAPADADDLPSQNTQTGAGSVEWLSSKINDQRHLINLLKQQLAESQMELKQLKILQAAERSKWQNRVTLLSSRLNESEERLVFETSLLANRDIIDNARKRMEAKWSEERRSILDNVQSLQAQNEMLARDLKKVSQSYDLLRLQAKQLETNNNKLSRKLIDYQQSHPGASGLPVLAKRQVNEFEHQLESYRKEKALLISQRDQLDRYNTKLVGIMRTEAVPLVEIVNKILLALDEPPKRNSGDANSAGSPITALSSGVGSHEEQHSSSSSTARPLRIPMTNQKRLLSTPTSKSKLTSDKEEQEEDDELSGSQADGRVSSARPAHKVATEAGQSRLSRLLIGSKRPSSKSPQRFTNTSDGSGAPATGTKPSKPVKRVRVKCASLGITATEKKRLRSHLQELNIALGSIGSEASPVPIGMQQQTITMTDMRPTVRRQQRLSNDESESTAGSRVHWQLDSDLESSEPNWLVGRSSSEQPRRPTGSSSNNVYRRFPQASPSNYGGGASLTDYESESSLASDFLPAGRSGRLASVGNVESDSAMQRSLSVKSGRKRTGLKSKLTSTLRSISRSITGLASDSEVELVSGKTKRSVGKLRTPNLADDGDGSENHRVREIRV